jgi:hypothetical protein
MDFCLPTLKLLLLAAIMGAMALPAGAQQSGQSIIFSSPQNDDVQSATPSLSPQNSQLPVLPGSLQAPDSVFNFHAPNDLPMLPPATTSTPQDLRMKKILEERKNWTLMTPAEIFGVTTTEEMLKPPERDAMGRGKNPTQLERYLDRENQSQGSLTNGWQNDRGNSPWNFSRDQDSMNPLDSGRDSTVDTAQKINRFLSGQGNGDEPANRNQNNYGWDSFSQPATQTPAKPDLEQMAAMERFRQLLEPGSAPAAEQSSDSKFFPLPKTALVLDPNMTQPDFVPNPAGASFTPLSGGIGKPSGLTPLPGIVTPVTPTTTVPAWTPRPAPWLSQGPQPFVMPQRKF